jgi:tripartite-type tricarboxylate transporter receptor subunit TctC
MKFANPTLAVAIACATLGWANAQAFPVKPIRLVVPYPPGGGTDTVARPLAQNIAERLGQPVVIDNRGGASGIIGMELVARAPADGYTQVFALSAQLSVNPVLFEKLPYDPLADFAPVSQVAIGTLLLGVHPSLPVKTVRDLVALAKARPGQITYASSGIGSAPHLAGELLAAMTGVRMVHVPYKGGRPALSDTLAGHVHVLFGPVVTLAPHVKTGRLRPLGVTTLRRASALPDVPTIAEAGVKDYESSYMFAVLAPAGTPRDAILRTNTAIAQALRDRDYLQFLTANGIEPRGGPPEDLTAAIKAELVKWGRLIREAKVKAE